MATIPQVCDALRKVLTTVAEQAGKESGLVKRSRKLTGDKLAQTLVFGWMNNGQVGMEELSQTALAVGVKVSPQAIDQRLTKQAADCMKQVLEAGVEEIVAASPVAVPVLEKFNGVYLQDSSTIVLPDTLCEVWLGCGGNTAKGTSASVKMQVRLDLCTGTLAGPYLQDGRRQDRNCQMQQLPLPAGALRIADLGYFSLDVMERLSTDGVYWLSRVQAGTVLFDERHQRWNMFELLTAQGTDEVDIPIYLGLAKRLSCRLLGVKVPPEVAAERRRKLKYQAKRKYQTVSKERLALAGWNIYVTNVPKEMLSFEEALVLGRARWQIELLFKLWKSVGQADQWKSSKPWRILCELYAKLLGLLIQHWAILIGCWENPDRSLTKAVKTIRSYAMAIASALSGELALERVFEIIQRCIKQGCRMNRRRQHPNTYQLLLQFP